VERAFEEANLVILNEAIAFPRLYPIIDKATLDAYRIGVDSFAGEMARAGVGVLQYRDKLGAPQEILRVAAEIAVVFAGVDAMLILNDRADLAVLAGWGVHVGQGDVPVGDARRVLGAGKVIGVSTHNDAQVIGAEASEADYVAVGPVFRTSTKVDAEAVVGLEGVRRARALTDRFSKRRALVAIGGITRENARSVMEAGADSVAVIGGLLVRGERVGKVAEDFLEILR
jgi:thiamine-phosphate pyrophosphorylase